MNVKPKHAVVPLLLLVLGFIQPILLSNPSPSIWWGAFGERLSAPPEYAGQLSRLHKPWILSAGRWEGVYLGGSRVMQTVRPSTHHPDRRFYNAAFSGPAMEEVLDFGQHSINSGVREIFVSLPFIVFLHHSSSLYRTKKKLLDVKGSTDFSSLHYRALGYQWVALEKGMLSVVRVGRIGSANFVDKEGVQEQYVDGRPCGYAKLSAYRNLLERYWTVFGSDHAVLKERMIENLYYLESLLKLAKQSDVIVRFVVLPVHDSLVALRSMRGATDLYLDWLDRVRSLSIEYGVASVAYFGSLTDVSSVPFTESADEAVPSLPSWKDPAHTCEAVGARLQLHPLSLGEIEPLNKFSDDGFSDVAAGVSKRHNWSVRRCARFEDVLNNCFAAASQ